MKIILCVLTLFLALPTVSQASNLYFTFTGRLVVVDPYGNIVQNNGSNYTPIEARLSFDPAIGEGSSNLSITMPDFLGLPATFHGMTLTRQTGTSIVDGNVLLDWATPPTGGNNMPLHVQWDATGLINAIGYGLEIGDILSGTYLYRDAVAFGGNGDGIGDPGELLGNIFSASPYSDSLYSDPEGPAPLAATSGSMGVLDNTVDAYQFKGYFNIGSGNSMHVVAAPIPATVWLFGSGLVGLIGIARHKKAV
jgi:hypothetical protein